MRTLHIGLRVSDLNESLAFYAAVGYTVVGTVAGTPFGTLTMLRLPGDSFVAIELVHDPVKGAVDLGTGINHLVIQVESLDELLARLAARGIEAEPPALPGGPAGPRTAWVTDPDGYRIELVQWPAGHADGMTEADFSPLPALLSAVPVLADDGVQHFGGLVLVLADDFHLGRRHPGRHGPRIPFPSAVDHGEPVEHLAVSTHDPLPGHLPEIAGGTAVDLGDHLRGKQCHG